jgi:hypothetical protein
VKNVRPTISAYMYGNARALAEIARHRRARGRSRAISPPRPTVCAPPCRQHALERRRSCSSARSPSTLEPIAVREQIGFIPWYFSLPEPGRGYERAWAQFNDNDGDFARRSGITTAERQASGVFDSHGVGTCEWDGAVWPFATSQTLVRARERTASTALRRMW